MVNHRFQSLFAFVINCVHNVAAATSFARNVTAVNATLSYDVVSQTCNYLRSSAAAELACAEFRAGHGCVSGLTDQKKNAGFEASAFIRDIFPLFRYIFDIWNFSSSKQVQPQDINCPVGSGSVGHGSDRYLLWNCNVKSAVSMLLRGIGALRPSQSCHHSISEKH